MMEFAVVLVVKLNMDGIKIQPKNEENDARSNHSQNERNLQIRNCTGDDSTEDVRQNKERTSFCYSFALNRRMDFAAFFIFILGFFVFNIIYWKQLRQDFVI